MSGSAVSVCCQLLKSPISAHPLAVVPVLAGLRVEQTPELVSCCSAGKKGPETLSRAVESLSEGLKVTAYATKCGELLKSIVDELFPPSNKTELHPIVAAWLQMAGAIVAIRRSSPLLFSILCQHLLHIEESPLSCQTLSCILDRSVPLSLRPGTIGGLLCRCTTEQRLAVIENSELLWHSSQWAPEVHKALNLCLERYSASLRKGLSLKSLRWVEVYASAAVAKLLVSQVACPSTMDHVMTLAWGFLDRLVAPSSPSRALRDAECDEEERPTTSRSVGQGRIVGGDDDKEELAAAIASLSRSLCTALRTCEMLERRDVFRHRLWAGLVMALRSVSTMPVRIRTQLCVAGLSLVDSLASRLCELPCISTGVALVARDAQQNLDLAVDDFVLQAADVVDVALEHMPAVETPLFWAIPVSSAIQHIAEFSARQVSVAVATRLCTASPTAKCEWTRSRLKGLSGFHIICSRALTWQVVLSQVCEALSYVDDCALRATAAKGAVDAIYWLYWHFACCSDATFTSYDAAAEALLASDELDEDCALSCLECVMSFSDEVPDDCALRAAAVLFQVVDLDTPETLTPSVGWVVDRMRRSQFSSWEHQSIAAVCASEFFCQQRLNIAVHDSMSGVCEVLAALAESNALRLGATITLRLIGETDMVDALLVSDAALGSLLGRLMSAVSENSDAGWDAASASAAMDAISCILSGTGATLLEIYPLLEGMLAALLDAALSHRHSNHQLCDTALVRLVPRAPQTLVSPVVWKACVERCVCLRWVAAEAATAVSEVLNKWSAIASVSKYAGASLKSWLVDDVFSSNIARNLFVLTTLLSRQQQISLLETWVSIGARHGVATEMAERTMATCADLPDAAVFVVLALRSHPTPLGSSLLAKLALESAAVAELLHGPAESDSESHPDLTYARVLSVSCRGDVKVDSREAAVQQVARTVRDALTAVSCSERDSSVVHVLRFLREFVCMHRMEQEVRYDLFDRVLPTLRNVSPLSFCAFHARLSSTETEILSLVRGVFVTQKEWDVLRRWLSHEDSSPLYCFASAMLDASC